MPNRNSSNMSLFFLNKGSHAPSLAKGSDWPPPGAAQWTKRRHPSWFRLINIRMYCGFHLFRKEIWHV